MHKSLAVNRRCCERYRATIFKTLAIFITVTSVLYGPTGEADDLDACELGLENLIRIVEEQGQISEDRQIPVGDLNREEYSICQVGGAILGHSVGINYSVWRHRDDVTVFIFKRGEKIGEGYLFGPFYSAYRK